MQTALLATLFAAGVVSSAALASPAAGYADWLAERWPVERWRIGEGERIEVWPVPAENGDGDSTREGQLKVWGIRNLRPLVADDDRCDLDSELLVLFVAADLLVPVDKEEATRKLAAAEARYLKMRGNLTPPRSFKLFGGAEVAKRVVRGPPTIHYRDRETG